MWASRGQGLGGELPGALQRAPTTWQRPVPSLGGSGHLYPQLDLDPRRREHAFPGSSPAWLTGHGGWDSPVPLKLQPVDLMLKCEAYVSQTYCWVLPAGPWGGGWGSSAPLPALLRRG